MPSLTSLIVFSGASLVLLVIPGPAVLYIVTRGASQGRRAALVSVAGVHVGTVVHILAAVVGLSAVIVASATAFTTIKLAGATYLVYLGIGALRTSRQVNKDKTAPTSAQPMRRVFGDAVVLNILNPKTAVFFLAFVPQFIDVDAGNTTAQLLVLGATFIGLGLLTDGAYAIAAGWIGSRMANSPALARRKDLLAGSTYIGLGLVTATLGARQ